MATYFEGAVKSGTTPSEYQNVGYAAFTQTVLINFVAEAGGGSDNVDTTMTLPAGAQIIDFYVDTLTQWDSVTAAGLTIGNAVGGSQYVSSVDVKTSLNGRARSTLPAYSVAQLAAMDDIGTNNTVHIRVAQSGNTTTGQARVTALYVPRS